MSPYPYEPQRPTRAKLSKKKAPPMQPPAARTLKESDDPVTLQEVLVAFQKSLARAARSAEEASRAKADFSLGDRTLYAIDGLNVELNAAVSPVSIDGVRNNHIRLDLNAPPEERSRISFRVEARPLELETSSRIMLADLDPLKQSRPIVKVRAIVIGRKTTEASAPPQPLEGVTVEIMIIGQESGLCKSVTGSTNPLGQLSLTIDPAASTVQIAGEEQLYSVNLRNDQTFFVLAVCTIPAAAEAGRPGAAETPPESAAETLTSNTLRFNIDRSDMT
jgi:hypothetical protein